MVMTRTARIAAVKFDGVVHIGGPRMLMAMEIW
jgi:hypothetical protein